MLKISTDGGFVPSHTINVSVPREVKEAFDRAFAGENKSAIIARLMQEAVDERRRKLRRSRAVDALLDLRRGQPAANSREVARARRRGRP